MHLLEHDPVFTNVATVVRVPYGTGAKVHNDRPSHGFAYLYGGRLEFTFQNGTAFTAEAGDLVYMPKGSYYTSISPDTLLPTEGGCIAVNFHLAKDPGAPPFRLRIRNKAQMLSLFESLLRHRLRDAPGDRQELYSELYRIFALLKTQYAQPYSARQDLTLLQPALDHISAHCFQRTIPTGELAKLCGISQSYLRKLFGRALGLSPVEYTRQLRLAYARELLKSGEYTVWAAAEQAGFRDPAYFSREFRKLYRHSPSSLLK